MDKNGNPKLNNPIFTWSLPEEYAGRSLIYNDKLLQVAFHFNGTVITEEVKDTSNPVKNDEK